MGETLKKSVSGSKKMELKKKHTTYSPRDVVHLLSLLSSLYCPSYPSIIVIFLSCMVAVAALSLHHYVTVSLPLSCQCGEC